MAPKGKRKSAAALGEDALAAAMKEHPGIWRGRPELHHDGFPFYKEDLLGAIIDVTYKGDADGPPTVYRLRVMQYISKKGLFQAKSKGLSDWDGESFTDQLDLNVMLREGDMQVCDLIGEEVELDYGGGRYRVTIVAPGKTQDEYIVCSEGLSDWDGSVFCDDIHLLTGLEEGRVKFMRKKRFLGLSREGVSDAGDQKAAELFAKGRGDELVGSVVDVMVGLPPQVYRMRIMGYSQGVHHIESYGKYGMRDGLNWSTDINVATLCRKSRLIHVAGSALKGAPKPFSPEAFRKAFDGSEEELEDEVDGEGGGDVDGESEGEGGGDAEMEGTSSAAPRKRPAAAASSRGGGKASSSEAKKVGTEKQWLGKTLNVLFTNPKRTIKQVRVIQYNSRTGLHTVRAEDEAPVELDLDQLHANDMVEICQPWTYDFKDSGKRAGRGGNCGHGGRFHESARTPRQQGGASASSGSRGGPVAPPEKKQKTGAGSRATAKKGDGGGAAASAKQLPEKPKHKFGNEMAGRVLEVAHTDDPDKLFIVLVSDYDSRTRKHRIQSWGPQDNDPAVEDTWIDLEGLETLGRMKFVDGEETLRHWGHTLVNEEIAFLPQDGDPTADGSNTYLRARLVGWWPQALLPPVATEGVGEVRQAIFMAQESETGDRWQLRLSDAMMAVAQSQPQLEQNGIITKRRRVLFEVFAGSCELSLAFHRRGAEASQYDLCLSSDQDLLTDDGFLDRLERDPAWDIVHFAPPEASGDPAKDRKLEDRVWAAVRLLHGLGRAFVLESPHGASLWNHEGATELLNQHDDIEVWNLDFERFGASDSRIVKVMTNRPEWLAELRAKSALRPSKRPSTRQWASRAAASGDEEEKQLRMYPKAFAEAYAEGVIGALMAATPPAPATADAADAGASASASAAGGAFGSGSGAAVATGGAGGSEGPQESGKKQGPPEVAPEDGTASESGGEPAEEPNAAEQGRKRIGEGSGIGRGEVW